MRLWSLHPNHLDAKGLVALWREGLLARAVLAGATKGYRHHPQLERFAQLERPLAALDVYLGHVLAEATERGYHFAADKIGKPTRMRRTPVSAGQIDYEWQHLLEKLRRRDPARWERQRDAAPECHPSLRVVPGPIEPWERVR